MIITISADPHAEESPRIEVLATYPAGEMVELPKNGTLYIRVRYQSDQPLRFGITGDSLPNAGRMTNTIPVYPAGQGEALVWVAYREAQWVNGVPLKVSDAQWQPLATLSVPVQVYWSAEVQAKNETRPSWVRELSQAQQSLNRAASSNADAGGGFPWFALIGPMFLLHIFLQYRAWRHWRGAWRIAGIIPLAAFILMLGVSLFALFMGSNLWAIGLVFLVPVLFVYLLALTLLKLLLKLFRSG